MNRISAFVLCVSVGVASPAAAQFGTLLEQGAKRAKQVNDFRWTDEEKAQLGGQVSELVRKRYGVVQDAAVHKYVTLVGRTVAERSSRPELPWTFVVLDTDAVNAFAAPHGYVHITRGALALMKNEAELAGVLAHEIVHVAEEHTIDALKKNTLKSAAAEQAAGSAGGLMTFLANAAYDNIVDNAYSRGDENASDTKGIALVSAAGYAPQGLGSFLATLAERNKSATEKRGLFSSHPEMQARQDRLTSTITSRKLEGTQLVESRYTGTIRYKPVPQAQIATVAAGTRGLAGGGGGKGESSANKDEAKAEQPKKKGFGLGRLVSGGGSETKSAQVVGSGGARGLDPEKDAKGGSNPNMVAVTVTRADLDAFKKAGKLT